MVWHSIRRVLIGGILFILIAGFICVNTFHVTNVQIRGSKYFDAQELAEDVVYKNRLTENSLFLLWKYRNGVVDENTPYLRAMEVRLVSPSTVEFTIFEKPLVGCYYYGGEYFYFDSDGTVLKVDQDKMENVPLVVGLSAESLQLYQPIPSDNLLSFDRLLDITQILEGQGIKADTIMFGKNGNISILLDSIEAILGTDSNLDAKVETLVSILPNVAGKTGKLHLESITGTGQMATFKEGEISEEASNALEVQKSKEERKREKEAAAQAETETEEPETIPAQSVSGETPVIA